MAAGTLASALREFELGLDDVSSNLEFVRSAARLRPRLGGMLNWEALGGEDKHLITNFLDQRALQESLLYRGLIISLARTFEQFTRRIIHDAILGINKDQLYYDAINDALLKQNLYRTGIALQTIFEPPDHLNLDYELLAKNLGTCFAGSKQPVLNAEAFAVFFSTISPEKLADAFTRLGIKLQWDTLGQFANVRKSLDKKDTRETAKALQEFLKRFGQMRNKIAHSGSTGIVITQHDIEHFTSVFRALGPALAKTIEQELERPHR